MNRHSASSSPRRSQRLPFVCGALFAALLTSTVASHAARPVFIPNESLVTSRADLFDPEFDQKRGQFTWVDSSGRLWVAAINRDTGLFEPSNGKGTLVDPDAENSADLQMIGNGPEWLPSAGADRIVYTKFLANLPHTIENARVAMAQQDSAGVWHYDFLSAQPRYRAYASDDAGDPMPRVSYVDPSGNAYWRYADNPASETPVPGMAAPRTLALRFVEGQHAAIYVSQINGVNQVVRYWLDTGVVEQLTFDGGQEKTASPFMWRAPEFDNDYVFLITDNSATEMRIYRQVDKTKPEWTVVYRASAPVAGTKLNSPEPFVYNGKSYVLMSGVVPPNNYSSVIYLSSIDPAVPLFRQLSPNKPLRTRTDPEVFVTSSGPYIYYYRADRSTTPPCPCYEGIYRSDTGLGRPITP